MSTFLEMSDLELAWLDFRGLPPDERHAFDAELDRRLRASRGTPEPFVSEVFDAPCSTCSKDSAGDQCANSKRPCGHHCNHASAFTECDWCGQHFISS